MSGAASPAASPDRRARIIIAGISATALVAAPGSCCFAAIAAKRPAARQAGHASRSRALSPGGTGPGPVTRTAAPGRRARRWRGPAVGLAGSWACEDPPGRSFQLTGGIASTRWRGRRSGPLSGDQGRPGLPSASLDLSYQERGPAFKLGRTLQSVVNQATTAARVTTVRRGHWLGAGRGANDPDLADLGGSAVNGELAIGAPMDRFSCPGRGAGRRSGPVLRTGRSARLAIRGG